MNKLIKIRAFGFLALFCAGIMIAGCGGDNNNTPMAALPVINGITPAQVALGQRNVEGTIQGQNLSGVVSVDLGAAISVQSFQSLSASEIAVVFTVAREAQPGPRAITVTTGTGAGSSAAIFTVDSNQVPVALFTISPRTGSKNEDITFDASGSTDQDGAIKRYEWQFGDGQTIAGKIVTHKFAKAGSYQIQLNVTDNRQAANFVTRNLEIQNNLPPVPHFVVSPSSGDTNTEFTFDGSDSTDSDGRIIRYSWSFGDGQKAEGKTVKHVYANDKTFTVGLIVTDNDNAQGLREKDLVVEKGHSGGGGGGCHSLLNEASACSGFEGQQFCVVSIQGNTMITSNTLQRCPGKCGEVRRRADGIREFVGDIDRIDGTRVTLDYGSLPASTRPRAGERLRAIWRSCN